MLISNTELKDKTNWREQQCWATPNRLERVSFSCYHGQKYEANFALNAHEFLISTQHIALPNSPLAIGCNDRCSMNIARCSICFTKPVWLYLLIICVCHFQHSTGLQWFWCLCCLTVRRIVRKNGRETEKAPPILGSIISGWHEL